MWQYYLQPTSLEEALGLLRQHAGAARIVAGGTDLMVELSRGVKPTATLIDITKIQELAYIRHENGLIHLGALTTHNDVIASEICVQHALPLAQACWELGAPPIRTRATVAGNLVTASPANDTISALLALDAALVVASATGERVVALRDFYTGFRQTQLQPNELVREIRFQALGENERGLYMKLGLRRAQAISVIHLAFVVAFDRKDESLQSSDRQRTIHSVRIALGCLAPTVVRAHAAEAFLVGKTLTPEICAASARLCADAASPIADVRGSAAYRIATLQNLAAEGLRQIAEGRERENWPAVPALLETRDQGSGIGGQGVGGDKETRRQGDDASSFEPSTVQSVETMINGLPYSLPGAQTKTLLDALREDAGLTGTKSGCNEGECGACAVWLDNKTVMSCLTPAGQAHGAQVTTIEGLGEAQSAKRKAQSDGTKEQKSEEPKITDNGQRTTDNEQLHPLQAAFIRNAAVQCGYCIPGMLMAGAKLLEECPQPTPDQARAALSGNICRCTGYRKIVDAVMDASEGSEVTSQESA